MHTVKDLFMSSYILFLVFMAFITSCPVMAHDFEVDGIYYNITVENSEVAVTYKGNTVASSMSEYIGIVNIPDSVIYDGIVYRVTSIDRAFTYCSGLTSVTISKNITSISSTSFLDCTKLKTVTWNAY